MFASLSRIEQSCHALEDTMVIGDDHHRRVKVLGDAMGELQDPGQRKRSTGDELHRETAMKKHGHSSDDRPVQYRGNRSGRIRGQALANADRICPKNAGGSSS